MIKRFRSAADFTLSREKNENISVSFLYRARYGAGDGHIAQIAGFYREHAAFGMNNLCVTEMIGNLIRVQGRRHHHKSQIGP